MTIELITGTPGAGKTCYAVAKRIVPEGGRTVQVEDEFGVAATVQRRVVVAGIRELKVPHERLPHTLTGERVTLASIEQWNAVDADKEPIHKRLPSDPPQDVEASLFNWWLWCRPGDLIVVDEVQYIVPRGTLGKDPPHYIKTLEIHRHYGVDFLFITQDPQLLDPTMRRLVGLHRHVRAVLGGIAGLCMVYEWDHAANVERITHAVKAWYKRKPEYFKLYKSTVAVVAPPKSGRAFMWIVPLLFAAAAMFAWKATGTFRNGAAVPLPAAQALPMDRPSLGPASTAAAALAARRAPRTLPGWGDVPPLAGCYAVGQKCRCQAKDGRPVDIAPGMCRTTASSFDGLIQWERSTAVRYDPKVGQRDANVEKNGPVAGAASASTAAVY